MRRSKYHPEGCWCSSCKDGSTGPRPANSNFGRSRYGPTYVCCMCGKRTRETGLSESQFKMCAYCFEVDCWNNTVSDNDLSDAEAAEGRAALNKKYGRTE